MYILITLTTRIPLSPLLLRQMPLAIRHHPPHVLHILFLVPLRILVRILLQNRDDLATAVSARLVEVVNNLRE
jgi:hypothetical protein